MPTDTSDRILRLKTVLDRTGLSRLMICRRMQKAASQRTRMIGERSMGCHESAISAWLGNPMFYEIADRPPA